MTWLWHVAPLPRGVLRAYVVACAALWPWPVFGLLHVEASAVLAAVAFFASGWSVAAGGQVPAERNAILPFEGSPRRGMDGRANDTLRDDGVEGESLSRLYARHLAATLVPLALLALTLLWRPNCDVWRGAGFFLLFVAPSAVLGVSAGLLARALSARKAKRLAFVALAGLAASLGGVAFDLGLHPQFYTYNHVFGGVLGPIYDEDLVMRPGLIAFRVLTLLWAAGMLLAALRLRGRGPRYLLPALLVLIGLAYAFRGPLGINTPRAHAEASLGGHFATEHFDLYYAHDTLDARAVRRLALGHEFAYARLAALLGVEPPGQRVASYVYPDLDAKAALTGARRTSVAPVWLRAPQMHVALPDLPRVLDHELAHAFSKAFGGPLDASVSVGLVEGLAVALEPPDGAPPPREQVAALLGGPGGDALGESLAGALSPLGFWSGRGAVSYTTMGAFVGDLLEQHPAECLHEAYPWARFERAYGQPADTLVAAWRGRIGAQTSIARAAAPIARRRFAQPSLFEKPCPHYVPPFRRALREADDALAAFDVKAAARAIDRALAEHPDAPATLDRWARLRLDAGDATAVRERLAPLDSLAAPALLLRRAEALALLGDAGGARRAYDRLAARLPFSATASRAIVALRRALAGVPEAAAALVRIAPDSARAEALARVALPPDAAHEARAGLRWMEALLRAETDPARAATLLETPTLPLPSASAPADLPALLHRQRLAWRADFLALAGRTDAARAYTRAALAFEAVGDAHSAALYRHRAARAVFAARHDFRFSPPAS